MIGDEFKVWHRAPRPWYSRIRTYVYAAVLFATFQAGAYYNATRQMDAVGLPQDTSVVRDIGSYMPELDRMEVGML